MISFSFTDSDATNLYLAVDVVVQNISDRLTIREVPTPTLVILVYVASVIAFFVSTIVITSQLEEELSKLECFLKFLHMEALLKNKHMSTVMAKNMWPASLIFDIVYLKETFINIYRWETTAETSLKERSSLSKRQKFKQWVQSQLPEADQGFVISQTKD